MARPDALDRVRRYSNAQRRAQRNLDARNADLTRAMVAAREAGWSLRVIAERARMSDVAVLKRTDGG